MAPKKKPTTKPAKTPARSKQPTRPAASVSVPPPATSQAQPVAATPAVVRSKPRVARIHRATASPAQRRGAELTRYLRIHLKHPYADRGLRAIHKMALEVAHLARVELDAADGAREQQTTTAPNGPAVTVQEN